MLYLDQRRFAWSSRKGSSVPSKLYADDLSVGEVFQLGSWTVSLEEILSFGHLWDPLPIHVDRDAAKSTQFGEVIASGIHVVAIMQRLTTMGLYRISSLVAGRGIRDARLTRPIRAGTVLDGCVTIDQITVRDSGIAVVLTRGQLRDDRGVQVFEMLTDSLWATRRYAEKNCAPTSPSDRDRGAAAEPRR